MYDDFDDYHRLDFEAAAYRAENLEQRIAKIQQLSDTYKGVYNWNLREQVGDYATVLMSAALTPANHTELEKMDASQEKSNKRHLMALNNLCDPHFNVQTRLNTAAAFLQNAAQVNPTEFGHLSDLYSVSLTDVLVKEPTVLQSFRCNFGIGAAAQEIDIYQKATRETNRHFKNDPGYYYETGLNLLVDKKFEDRDFCYYGLTDRSSRVGHYDRLSRVRNDARAESDYTYKHHDNHGYLPLSYRR